MTDDPTPSDAASTAPDADLPAPRPPRADAEASLWSRVRRRAVEGLRHAWVLPGVALLIFVGGILGLYFQPPGVRAFFEATGIEPGGGTDTPIALPLDVPLPDDVVAALQPTDVVGLARLTPRGDVSAVAPPFGSGDARIDEILVAVGDRVARGDRVATLDNLASLESAVALAEATVALREATLLQTEQSVALSIAEAQATLGEARAAEDQAEADRVRAEELFQRGVATRAALDQAAAAATQAREASLRAEATLARFVSDTPADQPDVIVAQRNLEAARIELERAQRDLDRAYVIAPIAGVVIDIDGRPGASATSADGVMQIGDLDAMMAEAEIHQSQIARVAVGQPVELVSEALGERLFGRVESIGLQVERQEIVSSDTAANTDARIVRVWVALDAASSETAARFTNLEVVARIRTVAETGADAP